MKKFTTILITLTILILGTVLIFWFWNKDNKSNDSLSAVTSFEECVQAGNPVMESYPRQCFASGKTFAEDVGNSVEKQEMIVLETPKPNQVVTSPLSIKGMARGSWFFEASFPVIILDENGNILDSTVAKATSDWMTEDFVPFTAILTFNVSKKVNGKLVLEKDNPSELSENADSLEIPVILKQKID